MKAVSINDQHENGVDTSVQGNPTRGRLKAVPLIHVFRRNLKGRRQDDDGNPLIHALKGRRGFTITLFWEQQLMTRARHILGKVAEDLRGFDQCMPMPSSSPFCARFAAEVAQVAGAPLLPPTFLRKKRVGEVLQELAANPPRLRPALKGPFTSQLHAWQGLDANADYQAKDVPLNLRYLVSPFALQGASPDITGQRILIVDDLFATGSSMLAVREILQNQLGAEVAGVYFLSGV